MSSPKKGCLIRAASFDLFTLWNVFVELWASHGQKPYLTQIMEECPSSDRDPVGSAD